MGLEQEGKMLASLHSVESLAGNQVLGEPAFVGSHFEKLVKGCGQNPSPLYWSRVDSCHFLKSHPLILRETPWQWEGHSQI